MGTDSSSEQSKRRGFSLVEAAIVLAVVGLVLGGIWWAASAIYEDYKVNKIVNNVETIARNFQDLISIRYASQITQGNSYLDVGKALFDAGVFPKDFTYGIGTCVFGGNRVRDTYGCPVGLTAFQSPARMNVDYYLRKKTECIKILYEVASLTARMNRKGGYSTPSALVLIGTPSSGYISSSTFPLTIEQSKAACESFDTGNLANTRKLMFVYSFG